MFRLKGISEGTQVWDKQYTAVFDVCRKTEVEITFRVGSTLFHFYVFPIIGRDNITWLVKRKILTASHKV